MTGLVGTIFVLTYLLIASRRIPFLPIGRPGGALLGAVAMVAVGAIAPEETYRAIDHPTIILLFSMMLLAVYLDDGGFFLRVGSWLVERARTPWRLLVGISLLSAGLSAILLNDTICVMLTPLVVGTCLRARLPMGPYLIALATSANIGSAATIVGNPQNILIGSMSGLGFARFSLLAIVPSAVGLAVNLLLLALYYRGALPKELPVDAHREATPGRPPSHGSRVPEVLTASLPAPSRTRLALVVLAGIVVAFFFGLDRGYTALTGATLMVVLERKDPRPELARIDWPLLVFFCALFIVVAALAKTGLIDVVWAWAAPHLELGSERGLAAFTTLMTIGSNLVSNVPLVMLTGPHLQATAAGPLGWVLLGFVTTVAGNLTLVGSVANLIVAESAREHYHLGFTEYLRFGVVSTCLVLLAGVPALVVVASWLG